MCKKNANISAAVHTLTHISAEEDERRFQRAVEGGRTDIIFAKMKAFQDGKADGKAEGVIEGAITGEKIRFS